MLCEAYTKLRRLGLEHSNAVVLQINFHGFFVQSILGQFCIKKLYYAHRDSICICVYYRSVIVNIIATQFLIIVSDT